MLSESPEGPTGNISVSAEKPYKVSKPGLKTEKHGILAEHRKNNCLPATMSNLALRNNTAKLPNQLILSTSYVAAN